MTEFINYPLVVVYTISAFNENLSEGLSNILKYNEELSIFGVDNINRRPDSSDKASDADIPRH